MANVYGSRNLNQFPLPSVDSTQIYYTLVNSQNGEIILKRFNKFQIVDSSSADEFDITVGTIPATGPNKGKFIPNEGILGIGGITETEKKAFAQQPQAVQQVKDKALQTSRNALRTIATDQGIPVDESRIATISDELANNGVARTPLSGDPTSGDTLDIKELEGLKDNLKIKDSTKTRKAAAYPNESLLTYPINRLPNQDYIRFTMLEYAPKKINLPGIAEGKPFAERTTKDTQELTRRGRAVTLPIQPNISDSNNVRWGSTDMDAYQLIAATAALKTIDDPNSVETTIRAVTDLFKNSSGDLKTAFGAGYADAAASTKGLLTRVTGGIVNPNMELLFQGPDLRTFNFNFSLSAREENEAKNIRNIIRFFKQGMSVKRADTGLFLKSPHTFEIKYIYGTTNKDHPWINRIKECALTSCNVNYTPAGNYATYEDGSMTQYDISLAFSELEPIYDDDYIEVDGNEIDPNKTEIGY